MRRKHDAHSRRSARQADDRRKSIVITFLTLLLLISIPSLSFADHAAAAESDRSFANTPDASDASDAQIGATTAPDGQIRVAQADGSGNAKGSRPLEPRYQPLEPEPKSWYNGSYIFGMTRGLADSTIAPAAKGPLFLFTVPLDIAFLPFAVIGGMFG